MMCISFRPYHAGRYDFILIEITLEHEEMIVTGLAVEHPSASQNTQKGSRLGSTARIAVAETWRGT